MHSKSVVKIVPAKETKKANPKAGLHLTFTKGDFRLDNSKKRRFFAVLHQGSIDSAQSAVKAAIVSEVRKNTKNRNK